MDNDRDQKKGCKPRLRWSCELQDKFIDAVNQLGGPDKATPKGLMRIMEIPELTLYHFKSHLQRYRHVKGERFVGNNKQHVSAEAQNPRDQLDIIVTEKDDHQKELCEQSEVQRLLQVRIEAQGKYLQSVLMKAQETLFGHTSSNLGTDFARSELYGVESVGSCLSSDFSELTQADEEEVIEEAEGYLGSTKPENRGTRQTRGSADSSVTSSENLESESDSEFQSFMRK